MAEKGIFNLRTAKDLFEKLQRDFKRVTENPADSDAAFDFFVTAFHLWDWKGRNNFFVPKDLPQPDKATWQVCRQLANGSKHFEADDSHGSVKGTKLRDGAFQTGVLQSNTFQSGYLVVRVEAEPARQLGSNSIRVDILAKRLVEFWRSRLS